MSDSAQNRSWWAAATAHFRRWRLAYALALSAAIVTLSSFPISIPSSVSFEFSDKIAHGIAYCALGVTYINVATTGFSRYNAFRLTGAFAAVAAFGALDEWHQSFVPGRLMEFSDFVADTAGGLAAVVLSAGISRILANSRS